MRTIYLVVLLVSVFGFSEILCASTKDKEHIKKKTLLKLRTDINANETVHSADSLNSNGTESESVAADKESTVLNGESAESSDKEVMPTIEEEKYEESSDTSVSKPKPPPSYMTRLRSYLRKFLEYFGFTTKQKRKGRVMEMDSDNYLGDVQYTDELKATVGAVLGKRQCFKRAVCGAGKYLKDVKGKEMIIVLLEKFTPTSWEESIELVKKAAIYRDGDECRYECLEEK